MDFGADLPGGHDHPVLKSVHQGRFSHAAGACGHGSPALQQFPQPLQPHPFQGTDGKGGVAAALIDLGSIRELLPRRNELVRPAVANVDQALVVFSMARPAPSFNLLDRFLVGMGQQGIPCIVCFNKRDLDQGQEGERCREIYESCGYPSLAVSALEGAGRGRPGDVWEQPPNLQYFSWGPNSG